VRQVPVNAVSETRAGCRCRVLSALVLIALTWPFLDGLSPLTVVVLATVVISALSFEYVAAQLVGRSVRRAVMTSALPSAATARQALAAWVDVLTAAAGATLAVPFMTTAAAAVAAQVLGGTLPLLSPGLFLVALGTVLGWVWAVAGTLVGMPRPSSLLASRQQL
jgi:hypothetical protein